MAQGYTAQELIKEIRDLTGVNDTSADGATDADVLNHINAALRELIMPFVHNSREDYNLVRERFSVPASGLLRLPSRAMWNKLSNAWWIFGDQRLGLAKIATDFISDYLLSGSATPEGFYIEGNHVQFLPAEAGTVELCYFFRPGDLVKTTSARQVSDVNLSTGVVTFATNIPAAWEALPDFDVHSPSSGAEIKAWDVTPSAAAGTSVTFDAADIDGSVFGRHALAVGDWVCLAEEATLPAIPRELHPVICRAVALRYAEAEGDTALINAHAQLLDRYMKTAETTLEQRTEQKPLRISVRRSTLNAARRGGWAR